MIPQQALMNDALSPHTPSPFLADADATVTGTDIVSLADLQPQPVEWLCQHRLAAGTLAMLSGLFRGQDGVTPKSSYGGYSVWKL